MFVCTVVRIARQVSRGSLFLAPTAALVLTKIFFGAHVIVQVIVEWYVRGFVDSFGSCVSASSLRELDLALFNRLAEWILHAHACPLEAVKQHKQPFRLAFFLFISHVGRASFRVRVDAHA